VLTTDEVIDLAKVRSLTRSGIARSIRLAAGLSLSEMAGAVGASISAVHRWETGSCAPRGAVGVRYGRLLEELIAR